MSIDESNNAQGCDSESKQARMTLKVIFELVLHRGTEACGQGEGVTWNLRHLDQAVPCGLIGAAVAPQHLFGAY